MKNSPLEIVGIPEGRGRVVGMTKYSVKDIVMRADDPKPVSNYEDKQSIDVPSMSSGISNMPYEATQKLRTLRTIEKYLQAQLAEVQKYIQEAVNESVKN